MNRIPQTHEEFLDIVANDDVSRIASLLGLAQAYRTTKMADVAEIQRLLVIEEAVDYPKVAEKLRPVLGDKGVAMAIKGREDMLKHLKELVELKLKGIL